MGRRALEGFVPVLVVLASVACGGRTHPPGDDDDGLHDGSDGDADADSDPAGEGEGEGEDAEPCAAADEGDVQPGPREPDGVCTASECALDDRMGWLSDVETGDFFEDCRVCAQQTCVGDLATFGSMSAVGIHRPFEARVLVSNCGPSSIADPVHVQLVRPPDASGAQTVLANGWTPPDMPPWSTVWVDMVIDYDECPSGVRDSDKLWRTDADQAVTECDEDSNEPALLGPGC